MAHASIVGLSLGGAVAVDFAVTYPEATDALLPVDAALSGGYTWAVDAHWERLFVLAKASEAGLQAAKIFWLQHPFFTPACEQPAVVARLAEMVTDYSGWHLVHTAPGQGLHPPASQRLATIRAPNCGDPGTWYSWCHQGGDAGGGTYGEYGSPNAIQCDGVRVSGRDRTAEKRKIACPLVAMKYLKISLPSTMFTPLPLGNLTKQTWLMRYGGMAG